MDLLDLIIEKITPGHDWFWEPDNRLTTAEAYTYGGGDWFFLFMNTTGLRPLSDFLDADLLINRARHTYSGLTAQMARSVFTAPTNVTIPGTVTGSTERLLISPISFGLMVGFLVNMMAISLFLLCRAPRAVTPRDPSSIGGMMAIVSSSPAFVQLLANKELQGEVSRTEKEKEPNAAQICPTFHSSIITEHGSATPMFRIDLDTPLDLLDVKRSSKIEWWKPISTGWVVKILIMTLLLSTIATLEALFHASARPNGLAKVVPSQYVEYAWTYVPTFIMVLIGALLEGMHSTIRVLQPYHVLRRGYAPLDRSIVDEKMSGVALFRLFDSLRKRQFAMAVSSITVILAPLLTIAVSGLFLASVRPVSLQGISVTRLDQFNVSEMNFFDSRIPSLSVENSLRLDIAGLMIANNLPAPKWTTDTLALPELSTFNDVSIRDSVQSPQTFRIIVPALRGRPNCSFLTYSFFNITSAPFIDQTEASQDVTVNYTLNIPWRPEKCENSINSQLSLFDGPWIGTYERSSSIQFDPDCPVDRVFIGYVDHNTTTVSASIAECAPFLETVDAEIEFSVPGYTVLKVQTREETRRFVGHTTSDGGARFPKTNGDRRRLGPGALDNIFQNMVAAGSKQSISLDDFRQKESHQRILSAFQSAWQIIAAQNINIYLKTPLENSSSQPSLLSGTLMDDTRRRIVQSPISTRITQGILATIALCVLVLFILRRDSNCTVPGRSPTSIAEIVKLFAGSEMMTAYNPSRGHGGDGAATSGGSIAPVVQYWSDKELKKRPVFVSDDRFSLRWWSSGRDGEPRRFLIDQESAASQVP